MPYQHIDELKITASILTRFFKYISHSDENGCWIWSGANVNGGYGVMYVSPEYGYDKVPRVSWKIHRPLDPIGDLCICHTCDVRKCCSPNHLFLGTRKDNLQDMREKGRGARGSMIKNAKLTDDNVRDIRNRYACGDITMAILAEDYGIPPNNIARIISGMAWAHADGERSTNNRNKHRRRGESHMNAKLTADDVKQIRSVYAEYGIQHATLARCFGVTQTMISYIIHRKAWKHIE